MYMCREIHDLGTYMYTLAYTTASYLYTSIFIYILTVTLIKYVTM